MVAQKAVQTDAVSAAVKPIAVVATAAVADVTVVRDVVLKVAQRVAQRVVLRAALKVAQRAVPKVVAESAANAAQKRALMVYARSVRTDRPMRCAQKRRAMTAEQTYKPVQRAQLATKVALKTANHASPVPKVRAVSALAANVATAPSVVTAFRVMPSSRTLHWPTKPPWQPPCGVMALNPHKIVPLKTLAAVKAVVNVATATVAAMIAVVNAPRVRTRALNEMARSTLKRRLQLQAPRQSPCQPQTVTRLPRPRSVSQVKSNVNPESAAAVIVMAVTAASVVSNLNATKQALRASRPLRPAQHPCTPNQNRLRVSRKQRMSLLNM